MSTNNTTKIFVNLPVKDLPKAKEFFGKLGFNFNAQFSDDEGACMVVSEHAFLCRECSAEFSETAESLRLSRVDPRNLLL